MNDIQSLDPVLVGEYLMRLAMISRLMGHSDLQSTARDYLLPHDYDRTREQEFVLKVITGKNPLAEDEAIEMLQGVTLPALPA